MALRLLALLAVLLAALPSGAGEQQADELIAKASRARPATLLTLVRRDRAAAFEAVDRLAGQGDAPSLRLAEAIAEAYAAVFSDRRPQERLPFFRSLSDAQRAERARAFALKKDAIQAYSEGRADSTLEGLREACAIFEQVRDVRQTAWCAMAIAGVEAHAEASEAALQKLAAARAGLERVGDLRALCALENNLAVVARQIGALGTARESAERGVSAARALGDRLEEASQLSTLGAVLASQDESEHAIEVQKQAVALAAEIGAHEVEAFSHSNLGGLYREQGNLPAATQELRRAVSAAHEVGASYIEGDSAASLAHVLREQGQASQARVWLERAAALAAASESASLRAQVIAIRSTWLVEEGKAREALPLLEAAIPQAEATGDAGLLAILLEARANALWYLGRYEEAITEQRAAVEAAVRSGDVQEEAWRRNLLGTFLAVLGDFPAAGSELETAARVHAAGKNEFGRCSALGHLGFLHARTGDRERARQDLEGALGCATESGQLPDQAAALVDLARLALEGGASGARAAVLRLAEAAAIARRVNDTSVWTECELLTARAELMEGHLEAAKAALARVAPLGREKRTANNEWRYAYLRGRVAELEGDPRQAVRHLERAVREVEQLRSGVQRPHWKAAVLDDRIEPYRELVSLYLEAGQVESAYRVARLGKARGFAEKLVPASPGTLDSPPLPIPGWKGFVAAPSALRSLLRAHEALLDFFMTRERLVVFVVKREGIRARALSEDLAPLRQLSHAARDPGRPDPAEAALTEAWRRAMAQLGSKLIDPLAADLGGVDELLVVPNGALHSVAFAALPFEGAPLLEKRSVAVLPAAESLFSRKAARGAAKGLLALGDPELERRGTRLPGASAEIARVASFAEGPVFTASGWDASEAAYRARALSSEYIHLAAHARLDRIAPLQSRVELASGGEEDGSLTAEEVAATKIAASLVVLSGCETAQEAGIATEEAPGDEREGLVRAFLKAGAGTVVASLWEQSDSDSPAIFPEIYRALARGLAPGAALNRVQREMLHGALRGPDGTRLDHPFYWAGIVAYGAGR